MATVDDYRGTIEIHIHGNATNINAAGIVHGGVGHRTNNETIIRKEIAPKFGSLQGAGYKTTSESGTAQNITDKTSSQVRSAQGKRKETSDARQDTAKTSWVERVQKTETDLETAKLGSVGDGGQGPSVQEETGLPLRAEPAAEAGSGSGHDRGAGAVQPASNTGGCRAEARGAIEDRQTLETPVPVKEESESCQTAGKPRQLRGKKNSPSEKRQTDNDFHRACKEGDLDRVARILSEDLDNLNRKDRDGRTGLMVAAYEGHIDVVELLVTRGTDLTLVDKGGDTALHAACRTGDVHIVKCVLSKDELDVNSTDRSGMTAAMSAARWGYVDIVKLLIRRGANLQLVDDEGDNILHYACRGGHKDIVECIVSSNTALVNAKNRNGKTAVKVAKEEGHYGVYEDLKSVNSGCYLM